MRRFGVSKLVGKLLVLCILLTGLVSLLYIERARAASPCANDPTGRKGVCCATYGGVWGFCQGTQNCYCSWYDPEYEIYCTPAYCTP